MSCCLVVCRAAVVGVLLGTAAAAGWSAPAPAAGTFKYEVQLASGREGQPAQTVQATYYFKGRFHRMEMVTPGGKAINLFGPAGAFMLPPGGKEAMKFPVPRNMSGRSPASPFEPVAEIRKKKKVGMERVAGYQTEIYEETRELNRPGGQKMKMSIRYWIAANLQAPVKMVRSGLGPSTTMILKSADMKTPVPDSLFQLPKGVTVREAPFGPGRPGPRGTPASPDR